MQTGLKSSESDFQTMESGLQTVESGLQTVESGLQTVESGLQTVESGLQTEESGLQKQELSSQRKEFEFQTMESVPTEKNGLQIKECGLQTEEFGLQTKEFVLENKMSESEIKEQKPKESRIGLQSAVGFEVEAEKSKAPMKKSIDKAERSRVKLKKFVLQEGTGVPAGESRAQVKESLFLQKTPLEMRSVIQENATAAAAKEGHNESDFSYNHHNNNTSNDGASNSNISKHNTNTNTTNKMTSNSTINNASNTSSGGEPNTRNVSEMVLVQAIATQLHTDIFQYFHEKLSRLRHKTDYQSQLEVHRKIYRGLIDELIKHKIREIDSENKEDYLTAIKMQISINIKKAIDASVNVCQRSCEGFFGTHHSYSTVDIFRSGVQALEMEYHRKHDVTPVSMRRRRMRLNVRKKQE